MPRWRTVTLFNNVANVGEQACGGECDDLGEPDFAWYLNANGPTDWKTVVATQHAVGTVNSAQARFARREVQKVGDDDSARHLRIRPFLGS
jgi:hypothetical protein